jgi:transposase InsO family protein
MMCDLLNVSRAGFYAWDKRPESRRDQDRQRLLAQIRQARLDSDPSYGSPRIQRELAASGIQVSVNTVAKVMREHGIRSNLHKKFVPRTTDSSHGLKVAENLLDRRFNWKLPNQAWCCDITYIFTDEGVLYLAAVMDLCSRKIVGWAMADHMKASLCVEALQMALKSRRVSPGLICHSDRGVQYASEEYQRVLARHGVVCSMSRLGDCYDNAAAESFWGTLKTEEVYQNRYATRAAARLAIFKYIEVFYNRKRRHSSIGYISPEAFEASLN